jgi:hypothetical protein
MSAARRALRSLRRRLSYANVMATFAVFMVLGGGAYAAVTLPPGSVGKTQLREGAVTKSKIARRAVGTRKITPGSVTLGRLSPRVRRDIRDRGGSGPPGPAGATGPAGPMGPAGPGARRLDYSVPASATPTPETVLDTPGLKITATCELVGTDVQLTLAMTAPEASAGQNTTFVDTGTGAPPAQAPVGIAVNQEFDLPAGTEQQVPGPGAGAGEYVRANSFTHFTAASRSIDLHASAIVSGPDASCEMTGVAVTAQG